ncbi:hypothetical protein OESDEN_22856 [Oesophagostomum dentatum]|uniref:Uncharacterized protein n=1 Tax=Oesophagostomum dentatum TaxID=61180 RepID=A0A0B1RXW9_OESDE|nr:hypothetical protein OESDEN_22856 [Oesophagostomum dentatum]
MRFTILLVFAILAVAFAKPHPKNSSESSEEDPQTQGPPPQASQAHPPPTYFSCTGN